MNIHRRRFLRTTLGGAATALLAVGCGGSTGENGAASGGGRRETRLRFREDDAFYRELDAALAEPHPVAVTFDGTHRLSRDSRMFRDYLGNLDQEVLDQLEELDDEQGRGVLRLAFEEELLRHEAVDRELRQPNGEVIEPATVVLVVAILFIVAAASVAHAEGARGRSYRWTFESGLIELVFEGGP